MAERLTISIVAWRPNNSDLAPAQPVALIASLGFDPAIAIRGRTPRPLPARLVAVTRTRPSEDSNTYRSGNARLAYTASSVAGCA
ncbi:MAG: hypothetical protein ABI382_11210, partial [Nakamurella sp.]